MEQHSEEISAPGPMPPNGDGPSQNAPGQSDILGLFDQRNRQSPLELLVTGSTKIEEWALRTILTEQDVANIIEIMAEDDALDVGHMDVEMFLWRKAMLTISIDGRGRQDFKEVIGAASRREALLKGVLNGGLAGPDEKGGPRS